jgi:hypothetical protein
MKDLQDSNQLLMKNYIRKSHSKNEVALKNDDEKVIIY